MRDRIPTAVFVLAGIAAARASYMAALFVLRIGGVERRHVETAGYLLAAVLVLAGLLTRRQGLPVTDSTPNRADRVWSIIPVALGIAVYSPSLFVGLLSDDFVLLDRALRWELLPADWEFMRPVPLAVWATLGSSFGPSVAPTLLHALNVMLHLLNTVLVYAIAARLNLGGLAAIAAASLFAVLPLSVEPVVWASGVFDVIVASIALLLVLQVLRAPIKTTAAFAVVASLVCLALGTKETAVAVPFILAAAAFAVSGVADRQRFGGALMALVVVAVYLPLRIAWKGAPTTWPSSGYETKELITRPIAALALPLHADTTAAWGVATAAAAALIPILLWSVSYGWVKQRVSARVAFALVAWIFAAVAPLMTMMFVGEDLQGSRYLYLSAPAWSLLLAHTAAAHSTGWIRAVVTAALAMLIGFYAVVSSHYVSTWREAAVVRDTFLGELQRAQERCQVLTKEVPDTHKGAFVLRNGAVEALRSREVKAVQEGRVIRLFGCSSR